MNKLNKFLISGMVAYTALLGGVFYLRRSYNPPIADPTTPQLRHVSFDRRMNNLLSSLEKQMETSNLSNDEKNARLTEIYFQDSYSWFNDKNLHNKKNNDILKRVQTQGLTPQEKTFYERFVYDLNPENLTELDQHFAANYARKVELANLVLNSSNSGLENLTDSEKTFIDLIKYNPKTKDNPQDNQTQSPISRSP
jgi:hypothetical protein